LLFGEAVMPTASKRVFVSYSHKDSKWVEALKTVLAPWLRDKRLGLWSDAQIGVGQNWRAQIESEMAQARVAVLLVTNDFLASDFIAKHELPTLLARARRNQLALVWVAVGYSGYDATELIHFQAANDPTRPLESLRRAQRDKTLVSVAKKIADAATMSTLAGGLQIVDETTEPLEAVLDRRPERKDRAFGVRAQFESKQTQIAFTGATTVITAEDLSRLPEQDREFIADLEDSLERNYKRWSAIRKGLGDAGGALDDEVERQLTRVAKLMCHDLTSILNFLRQMHKFELEDHYGRYRYICERLHAA
jgi:hypothetical protein